jgi:aldehyde:ferredoxin oxidoreductase
MEFAMQAKGLEVAMHDGRALKSKGLGYAVSPIGARANSMTPANTWCRLGMPELMKAYDPKSINDNVELCIKSQNLFATMNSTGLCMFFTAYPGKVVEMYINFISAVTGWGFTLEEILKTGERIFNLQRVFNIRHGHTVDMDTLPRRFTHEPLLEGGAKGEVLELEKMLPLYYELRDWNLKTGLPSFEKLRSLGLGEV